MKFELEVRMLKPSVVLASIRGVLNANTTVELEMALNDHLRNPEVTKVIFEVPDLAFISSSGLRLFMIIIKLLGPRNGRLYMVGAAPHIIMPFKLAGMTKWIIFKNKLAQCEND